SRKPYERRSTLLLPPSASAQQSASSTILGRLPTTMAGSQTRWKTPVRLRVPDTTVFIDLIRQPGELAGFLDNVEKGHTFLSAVVAAELYAGTRSRAEALLVDEIVDAFVSIERLLTPTWSEWS